MNPLTFVRGVGSVAIKYGVEEAILLDTIVFWSRENKSRGENFKDGRWWTYNSIKGLAEIFPWWSQKQLRRILSSCIEQKALLVGNYNREKRDRTIWYSPSDDLLLIYGEDWTGKCICPNGQMEMPKRAHHYHVLTHVVTLWMPPIAPQRGTNPPERKNVILRYPSTARICLSGFGASIRYGKDGALRAVRP